MTERIEFDIYETPDGVEYNLGDWGRTFLLGESGQGLPPIEFRTTRGPFQHGETPTDYVLRPRVLQYTVRISANSRAKYWEERDLVLNIFRQNRSLTGAVEPGRLKKILQNGTTRALDVHVEKGLEFSASPELWDRWGSTEVIRFVAYDPVYYDPTPVTEEFVLGALSQLVFPCDFPILFGSTIIYDTATIAYLGTWAEYPIITITGPISQPIISNLTTGETISIYYNIPVGRVVTIDLRYGKKTILDDLGTNLLSALTTDSDMATWHLAPDPEADNGDNEVQVIGSAAAPGVTSVDIQYYNRYGGV